MLNVPLNRLERLHLGHTDVWVDDYSLIGKIEFGESFLSICGQSFFGRCRMDSQFNRPRNIADQSCWTYICGRIRLPSLTDLRLGGNPSLDLSPLALLRTAEDWVWKAWSSGTLRLYQTL